MTDKIKMTKSSGNIFADLVVENAEVHLARAKLALTINQIIAKRKLTQEIPRVSCATIKKN